MASELANKIADDIVAALFTNGAKQKARRLVLELENGHNGGGWSRRPARDHIADVIEKHIASIGAVEQSVQRTALPFEKQGDYSLNIPFVAASDEQNRRR